MLEAVVVLVVLIAIGCGGWILLAKRAHEIVERLEFAHEFAHRLNEYVSSGGTNMDSYGWLLHRSPEMQKEMAGHGIMRGFRPPFAKVMYKQYPIILNMLPSLREQFEDGIGMSLARQYANSLEESLVRYQGALDDRLERARQDLRNPFVAFRQGVQAIVVFPGFLLHWLGLGKAPGLYGRGAFVRYLTGIVSIIGLLAALITIVVGWSDFWGIMLPRLR